MKSHLHTFVNSYSAEVLFGTGTEQFAVPVMFDTGSSENWVISTECHDSDCEGHRKYSRTSTFVADPENRTLVTRFLSGSITSHLGRDTMNLGDGVVVPGGTFNLVTHMDVPVLKSLGWDGIIGLAFTSPEQRRQGRRSLIDHIKAEKLLTSLGRRNQFGYFVSPLGGMITFGGTSSAIAPIGDITWIPVNTSLSYWGLDIRGIEVDGRRTTLYNGQSILDTGTFLTYAPSYLFGPNQPLEFLRRSSCLDPDTLGAIHLETEVGTHVREKRPQCVQACTDHAQCLAGHTELRKIILTPRDYIITAPGACFCVLSEQTTLDGTCRFGIEEDDAPAAEQIGGWTFGHQFHRTFYTIFDW